MATTSRTEKEVWLEEALFGLDGHYRTVFSGGEGRDSTAEKAAKVASEK